MDKQIPYLFNEASFSSEFLPISSRLPNVRKGRVRLFYKYANRNGSYITDKVAEMLISSAPTKPVVGFFDRQKGDFTSHTGDSLCSAYGYIPEEPNFAWENHLDKDGVLREYACFDVILHSDYFPEANQIIGNPQSMEIKRESIDGDWAPIGDDIYFVYTTAELHGLCVQGKDVEPCFEGAAFFSQSSNFEKFTNLLMELQKTVKENEGGEPAMENETVQEIAVEEEQFAAEDTNIEVTTPAESEEQQEVFSAESESEESSTEETVESKDFSAEETVEEESAPNDEVQAAFEALEQQFNELQDNFNALTEKLNNLTSEYETLQNHSKEADAQVAEYEKQFAQVEAKRKQTLIDSYVNHLDAQEIDAISEQIEQFSYDELETKLAVSLARKVTDFECHKVPTIETADNEFATYMSKYKKN